MELCQGNTQLEQQILQVIIGLKDRDIVQNHDVNYNKVLAWTATKQITVFVKCCCAISGEPAARGFRKCPDTYE